MAVCLGDNEVLVTRVDRFTEETRTADLRIGVVIFPIFRKALK